METAEQLRATEQGQDLFKIHGMHHVEFYVGNAKQAAYYYRRALGFRLAGYMGPETGVKDRASYLVEQGKIRFVLTTPLHPDSPMAEHIMKHGDGVRDIALHVENAEEAYRIATERGARGVIVKLGAEGAYYATAAGEQGRVAAQRVERVVDTVGAGDGFAVGVVSALLEGRRPCAAVARGNRIGALAVQVIGDSEGLPTRAQLDALEGAQTQAGAPAASAA